MTPTEAPSAEPTVTGADRLTILKLLAAGRDADFVAGVVHLDRDRVIRIASGHGYPDTDKLAWAVDILTKRLDDRARAQAITTTAHARPTPRPRPTASPQPTDAPQTQESVQVRVVDETEGLLARAEKSEHVRTRKAAARARDAIETVRTALDAEEKARLAAAAAAAEKAKATAAANLEQERIRAQVAAAEAELAKLRAKLAKSQAAAKIPNAKDLGLDAKAVRRWAAEQQIACPAVGRVPKTVMTAYLDAHGGAS